MNSTNDNSTNDKQNQLPTTAQSQALTHIDAAGRIKMVDVGTKPLTARLAVAFGSIWLGADTLSRLTEGKLAKGDAMAASRVAAIMAAKRTWELLPLTHPVRLDAVDVHFFQFGKERLGVFAKSRATDRTGVEMEAMTAATVALLNVYDMVKAVARGARIEDVRLLLKSGGKSGQWLADGVSLGHIEKLAISKTKGTPKEPRDEAEIVAGFGVAGDAHGGDWHRQVSLLALESIKAMQAKGLDVDFGSFAENVATSGLRLFELPIGTLLYGGDGVVLEVTQIGKECHTRCAVYHHAGDCVMPREGIFARVLAGGTLHAGDELIAITTFTRSA